MTSEEFFNTVRDAIQADFRCVAHAGHLEHNEIHHDGSTSQFRLKASVPHVAFSLDKSGLDPFKVLAPGLNSRNDLTVVCLSADGVPLVFVMECKNSINPGHAQHQIGCGIAFCEYLFQILRLRDGLKYNAKYFGVAAYRPKSPPKGETRPKFVRQGNHAGLLRADWLVDVVLPLSELVRATENVK